jgi:MFS family permease
MENNTPFGRRFADALIMLVVSGLSLILLVYVGFGEARRTVEKFHIERAEAQGRLVQEPIESYLRAGLPLRQFAGFNSFADTVLESAADISSLAVFDSVGRSIFSSGDLTTPLLPAGPPTDRMTNTIDLRSSETAFQIVMPVRSKFEQVGVLAINLPKSQIEAPIRGLFEKLLSFAVGLSFAFAIFSAIFGPKLQKHWRQICFAIVFLTMSGSVVMTLISTYTEEAQSKTKALAHSLASRIQDVVLYNLNLQEMDGLDTLLTEYRTLNPDVSAVGVMLDDYVMAHTNRESVGGHWVPDPGSYEYTVSLTPPGHPRPIRVTVGVPTKIVFDQVTRSIKNFLALFVASAFLAGLFLQLAGSLQQLRDAREAFSGRMDDVMNRIGRDATLNIVRPIFFAAVFAEHLAYPFLPQYIRSLVQAAGLTEGYVAAPFIVYYALFALSLIPASQLSRRFGPRTLMCGGLAIVTLAMTTFMLPIDYYQALGARALAGVGQGMIFIGVQAYILAVAAAEKRTQAATVIVVGYQGGMIAGTAIGSLLVVYSNVASVFALGTGIAIAMLAYTVLLVPGGHRAPESTSGIGAMVRRLFTDIREASRSWDFLKAMICIGVPAKGIMTGVVTFALPLLLSGLKYPQEDIGQIIMLYALSVFASGSYIAQRVDKKGNSASVLFGGAVLSGVGLLMIGASGWGSIASSAFVTELIVAGVIVVGIAHGFINAPVITHVGELEVARRIGVQPVAATYRFLERIGHAVGPLMLGQLFVIFGETSNSIIWIGFGTIALAILFAIRVPGSGRRATSMESAT